MIINIIFQPNPIKFNLVQFSLLSTFRKCEHYWTWVQIPNIIRSFSQMLYTHLYL